MWLAIPVNDVARESVYEPVVRETLEKQAFRFIFGAGRITR